MNNESALVDPWGTPYDTTLQLHNVPYSLMSLTYFSYLSINDPPHFSRTLIGNNWWKWFCISGQHWKDIRHLLSPSFTISKIKAIHVLLCDNASKTIQYFHDKDEELIEVEVKDTFTRFTNDVLANTIFGLEINSFKDSQNEFYMMGKDASDFSKPWKIFVILLHHISSKLARVIFLPYI